MIRIPDGFQAHWTRNLEVAISCHHALVIVTSHDGNNQFIIGTVREHSIFMLFLGLCNVVGEPRFFRGGQRNNVLFSLRSSQNYLARAEGLAFVVIPSCH